MDKQFKMAKGIIVIAGYGTGVSQAVGFKFGSQGFELALLSRTKEKLEAAAAEFAKSNIKAKGYPVDLTDPKAVVAVIKQIKASGQLTILFWNPYGVSKSVVGGSIQDFTDNINVTTVSLVAAVQEAIPALEATKGAVLVTGGGLSLENEQVAQLAVSWGAATLAVSKAAQRKLVHVLHYELGPKGVFVGEVTVLGAVKGTPFDYEGKSTLTAESIAEAFDKLLTERKDVFASKA